MMKKSTTIKAVTYCRVSSTKQVRDGHGLVSQDTRCREYAKHKGYEVIEAFHDEGVSGSLIDRPKMQEMLDFLSGQDEQIIVLIDDISRLARGLEAHLQLRTAISSVGAKLESPSIEFGDDSDSILVENLLASVSQHQRQKNAEQVKNRMRARLMNGYWISNPMVGYKYKKVEGHGKMLMRHEPVATILQNALEKFACGQLETQSEFRDYLLAHEEFPRKKDGTIHLQQVKEMLKRVLYAGYISLPKWGIFMQPAKHEPLITYETYMRIQERLERKAKVPARKDLDEDFPLRGFVACNSCGHPLTSCWSRSANRRRYAYYLCQKKGCNMKGKSVRKEKIEAEFDDIMKSIKPTKDAYWLASDMFKVQWEQKRQSLVQDENKLHQERMLLEKKIEKLVERVVNTDSISLMTTYENSLRMMEQEKILLDEKILNGSKTLPDFDETFRTAMSFLSNPYTMWVSEDITLKRIALRLVFSEKITYAIKQGFRTPQMAEPIRISRGFSDIDTNKYDMVRLP